jgi:hypothetical protein
MCPFCIAQDAVVKVENILGVYLNSWDYCEILDKLHDEVYKEACAEGNKDICEEHRF